jgi:hypothetical protein
VVRLPSAMSRTCSITSVDEFRAVCYSPWTRYISPPEPQVVTKSLMRSIACLHVAVVTFRGNRRSLRGAVPPPSASNADPQPFPSRKSCLALTVQRNTVPFMAILQSSPCVLTVRRSHGQLAFITSRDDGMEASQRPYTQLMHASRYGPRTGGVQL